MKIDAPWRVWRYFRARKMLHGKSYTDTLTELVDLHAHTLDADSARVANDQTIPMPKVNR